MFRKLFAACNTAGSVHISFRLFLIPSMACFSGSRVTSPIPALNPFIKRSFSSFSRLISLSNTGFSVSSVSLAASTILSSRPPPAAPPSPPDPSESASSFFVSEWISSMDRSPPYSFLALLAAFPALSVAAPTDPMESAALSAAPPISFTVVVVLVFFPVIFAIILLKASVTVSILARRLLSARITGVSTAMRPCPMAAFNALNLSVSTLT